MPGGFRGGDMNHTPGPWILDIRVGCISVYSGEKENCLSEMPNSSNCLFWKDGKWDDEKKCWETNLQDEANARLIAAAPDLLEACKSAALLYDHLAMSTLEAAVKYGPDYKPPTDEDMLETRNCLNEAISKAEVEGGGNG
jgi:hypothetical protein